MSRVRNRVIFAVVIMVIAGCYLFLMHRPQSSRLDEVREQIVRAESQVAQDSARAQTIPQMIAEVEQIKREFSNFDRRLPKQQELAEFLREIYSTGESLRLADQEIKPGNPSVGALYNRLPIIMDFNCTFTDLVAFLDKMNHMTRLTRIEQIRMTPITDHSQDLKVSMQVNIYFEKS